MARRAGRRLASTATPIRMPANSRQAAARRVLPAGAAPFVSARQHVDVKAHFVVQAAIEPGSANETGNPRQQRTHHRLVVTQRNRRVHPQRPADRRQVRCHGDGAEDGDGAGDRQRIERSTSNSWPRRKRVAAAEASNPSAMPIITVPAPEPSTSRRTSARLAPSATRTPTSRVRAATV